jgi:hypothetical protein
MQISDLNRAPKLWLAAHLECAKEGRQRVTVDRVRFLSAIKRSVAPRYKKLKFPMRIKSQVQFVLFCSGAVSF